MPINVLSHLPRGAVVLIPFPFTDLTGKKKRPAVLISDPAACPNNTPDGHFVFLTTQQPPAHVLAVPIVDGSADAQAMGLLFPQPGATVHILPLKIATLEVSLVARHIGTAPASVLASITAALGPALGI